ncbi:unnamed protein product [Linum trigynum]|uniref:Uncharacterized protein n=1 Tax=Linum trigynum TaxID=586398 RepID=A0AAV2E1Q4_9ROSI
MIISTTTSTFSSLSPFFLYSPPLNLAVPSLLPGDPLLPAILSFRRASPSGDPLLPASISSGQRMIFDDDDELDGVAAFIVEEEELDPTIDEFVDEDSDGVGDFIVEEEEESEGGFYYIYVCVVEFCCVH